MKTMLILFAVFIVCFFISAEMLPGLPLSEDVSYEEWADRQL
ncbi:hypothetical protein [Paenibacillus whitsoniae]|nr:hypothetical protein [Paenibacillus whitsoniae]